MNIRQIMNKIFKEQVSLSTYKLKKLSTFLGFTPKPEEITNELLLNEACLRKHYKNQSLNLSSVDEVKALAKKEFKM